MTLPLEGPTLNPPPVEQQVRSYLIDSFLVDGQGASLGNEDDLLTVLSSLQILRTVIELESRYGIKVEHSELNPDNLGSISKIAAFVERKQASK